MQKSPLKISEYRHNGRLQSRVYYPKGSPNKPSGGYKWYRSRAASEQAIIENNALQKRYGEIAKDVTLRELVEARQAKDELIDTGLTLLDAARQVKLALNAALESKSVGDGLNAYLEDVRSKFDERKEHSSTAGSSLPIYCPKKHAADASVRGHDVFHRGDPDVPGKDEPAFDGGAVPKLRADRGGVGVVTLPRGIPEA